VNNDPVLITGASGYIGSLLTREIQRLGFKVNGLDIRSPQESNEISSTHRVLFGDITRPETLPAEIRKTAVLIHCAALVHRKSTDLSRSNYLRVNYQGTRNILRALDTAYLRRIIFLSTVSVYGLPDSGQVVNEQAMPFPVDPYGESKLAAEEEIRTFSHKTGVSSTIFRLAPIYAKDFLLNIDKRIYLPKQVAFYRIGDGTQRVSMCAVSNVVNAVSKSLEVGGSINGVFNLKDRGDYSINDIIAIMRTLNKHFHRPIIKIPGAPILSFTSGLMRQKTGWRIHFSYQINKIALGAVYSGEKLLKTGVSIPWSLSSELLGKGCS
jgi:nucleoside-diphosphate-sugar epimerase